MFWAYFSYDEKGPCYVWEEKTKKEKEEAKKWLEEEYKLLWEAETVIRRLKITRNIGGKKPT